MPAIPVGSDTSPTSLPPSFPAQGEFSSTPAPDLLADLVRRRFTGTLRVDRDGTIKVIYFSQGDFACASSNAEEDRLGNLLVRSGQLTAEQLQHAKSRQSERASIGNTLVELGFITAAELLRGARQQVEEIVADLLGWQEGTYQVRELPLSKEVVNLALPGRVLLVRALQQMADRALVVERLGSMEAVLSRAEPFEEAARSLDFGFPVEALLGAIDGRRSVREACETAGLDAFQACKVLYTLRIFGLLQGETRPARELIFIEGELQEEGDAPPGSETAPMEATREEETALQSARAGEPDAPAVAPRAPQAPPPPRRPVRGLVRGGAVALGLAALAAGIVYFTYLRPTLSVNEAEEARLLAALLNEAGEGVPPAPGNPSPAAPRDVATVPDAPARSPQPPAAPPSSPRPGPAAAPQEPPAASPRARLQPPPLEKGRPMTMLSADGNFRRAQELVDQGRFAEAAASFQRALAAERSGSHAIQLLLACQESTLEKAFARAPDRKLYFVATSFRGQACYRLLHGLYATEADASRDLGKVPPEFFAEGNRPVVVRAPRR